MAGELPPDPKPVWVVSGHPRSGTSMMMRALIAGGMTAAYDEARNSMARQRSDADYAPNPDAQLYELADWKYRAPDFPAAYAGKVIKAVTSHARLMDVVPGGTQVVFMRRDSEEIRQSYLAFFGKAATTAQIEADTERTLRMMRDRRSFQVAELQFRSVVSHPLNAFELLTAMGWPIDPVAAAACVDASRLRYRAEELTAGVV